MSLTEEQERDLLEFERMLSIIRGKVELKKNLMIILDPDKPQTTAFLTKPQAHFVSIAFFVAEKFKVFTGLRDFAIQVCLSSHAIDGKGIDASIRLSGAIAESKLLQYLGIGVTKKEKEND